MAASTADDSSPNPKQGEWAHVVPRNPSDHQPSVCFLSSSSCKRHTIDAILGLSKDSDKRQADQNRVSSPKSPSPVVANPGDPFDLTSDSTCSKPSSGESSGLRSTVPFCNHTNPAACPASLRCSPLCLHLPCSVCSLHDGVHDHVRRISVWLSGRFSLLTITASPPVIFATK